MLRYIQIWKFVRALHKRTLKDDSAMETDRRIDAIILGHNPAVSLRVFLKQYSDEKSISIVEISSLLRSATDSGLVIEEVFLNTVANENVAVIRPTPKGSDFSGFIPLLQGLLSNFNLAWSMVIFPLIAGLLGDKLITWLIL